jgi:hypothetical protein
LVGSRPSYREGRVRKDKERVGALSPIEHKLNSVVEFIG